MKHVQLPPDGEVLPLDPTPADDDSLLPHRSVAAMARARRCLHRSMDGGGRDEHLERCKERAREYLDAGELSNAVASMGSGPPELKPNPHLLLLGTMRVLDGDPAAVRTWVEGFR